MELLLILVLAFFVYRLRSQVRDLGARVDRLSGEAPEAPEVKAPKVGLETRAPKADRTGDNAPEPSAPVFAPWEDRIRGLVASFGVPDRVRGLFSAFIRNWPLVIAGVSLALGGIFMVQYGVEAGLLGPSMRVIGAALLGAALILSGEWLRRRYGDEVSGPTRAIPSTLSGSGLVALFAAPVAAHALYDLIGPGTGLVATTAVAGGAILLGWFHGRALAYGGVIGASFSPLLVDGAPDASGMLLYHQTLIALTGAAVGAIRGWHGLTLTALGLTSWMAWVIHLNLPLTGHMTVFVLLVFAIALLVAGRSIIPRHDGACASALLRRGVDAPGPATLIAAAGAVFAAGSLLALGSAAGAAGFAVTAAGAALAAAAMILVAPRAPALADLFAPFVLALVGMIIGQGLTGSDAVAVMLPQPQADIVPPPGGRVGPTTAEIAFRDLAPVLLPLIGLVIGAQLLGVYARRPRLARAAPFWSVFVPGAPAATALALQSLWSPAQTFGDGAWFLIVAGLAAALAGLVVPAARTESGPGAVTGQVAAGSAVMIAHAFFILLSGAALTAALGALLVALAVLDRLYRLRGFSLLIQAGTVLIGGRLLYDMTLLPALHGSAGGALLAQVSPILLMASAWVLLDRDRDGARITLESAVWGAGAIAAGTQIYHLLGERALHVSYGLFAATLIVPGLVQLYRLRISDRFMWWVRLFLGAAFLSGGGLILTIREALLTPLNSQSFFGDSTVNGPILFDTLAAGYLPIALIFEAGAWFLTNTPRWFRGVLIVLSISHAAAYIGLETRRFWRGDDLSVAGVTQPELYSYTVAMMLAAAGLLLLAWLRGSDGLRRLAMAGAAVTIAKVFLVDMEGLTGLIRVASFIGLGLALAGLAWVNRVIRDVKVKA